MRSHLNLFFCTNMSKFSAKFNSISFLSSMRCDIEEAKINYLDSLRPGPITSISMCRPWFTDISVMSIHALWTHVTPITLHYNGLILGAMVSQITSLTTVYSTVYSDADQRKCQSRGVTGFCAGNSPVTGEFPRQMASYAENVSIWWRHHEQCGTQFKPWGRQERALLATEKMNLPHLRLFFLTKQLIHLMWSRLSIKAIANYSCIPKCIHVYW